MTNIPQQNQVVTTQYQTNYQAANTTTPPLPPENSLTPSKRKILFVIMIVLGAILICGSAASFAYIQYKDEILEILKIDTGSDKDKGKDTEEETNDGDGEKDGNTPEPFSSGGELLTQDQIENYYQKGEERFVVWYYTEDPNNKEEFISEIEPIVKTYIAYSEYTIEQNIHLFSTNESDKLKSLGFHVYETYDLINKTGELPYRYIIAYASAFTYGTSCFFDYKNEEIPERDIIKTATHETTHLLQYSYSKNSSTNLLPSWYKEGMAEHMQFYPEYLKEKYPEIYNSRSYPATLDELEDKIENGDYDTRIYCYIVAREFFEYLVEKKGLQEVISLLGSTGYDDFHNNFETMFRKSADDVYIEFAK